MSTSKILAALAVFTALGTGLNYAVRCLRHARHDLVTLNVRNAPLAQVLDTIARQTRETVVGAASLEIPVNLQVNAMPIGEVLDLLAEQTGAFWRRTDAVHRHPQSLARLIQAIRSGVHTLPVGWTNPAPKPAFHSDPSWNLSASGPGSTEPIRLPLPSLASDAPATRPGPKPTIEAENPQAAPHRNREVRVLHPGPGALRPSEQGASATSESWSPPTTLVLVRGDNGVKAIDLSPERLLVEHTLVSRISDLCAQPPDPSLADRMAERIRGRHSIVYSLEATPISGVAGELHHRMDPQRVPPSHPNPGTKGAQAPHGPPGIRQDIEGDLRRHRFGELSRLSPEQRARQQAARAVQKADDGANTVEIEVHR